MFRSNVGLMRQLMALDEEGTPSRNSFHLLNRDILTRKRTDVAYVLGGMVDEFLAQRKLCRPAATRAPPGRATPGRARRRRR